MKLADFSLEMKDFQRKSWVINGKFGFSLNAIDLILKMTEFRSNVVIFNGKWWSRKYGFSNGAITKSLKIIEKAMKIKENRCLERTGKR